MKTRFYEVKVRNRVVKGSGGHIMGTQGTWHEDHLYYLAESQQQAIDRANQEIKKRPMLGIPRNTKRRLRRVVEIIETRRLG